MQRRLHRHLLYTRLIRPVARLLAWSPLLLVLVFLSGPLAVAIIIVLIPVVVISMLMSFRPSVSATPRLSEMLSRNK